jgi:putative hydrolase of the HAD superfamily
VADKAILWDFDGTLAYRKGLWSGCLAEVLQEREPGAGITRDDVRPLLHNGFPWHTPERPHPELGTPDAWWEVVEALLFQACRQLGLSEVKARAYARETHERYIDVAGFRLFDDTLPVLSNLKEEGWRHVILSNHVPELRDIVEGLRLAELIDDALSSAVTGYEKPNPKAFELGREAAGNPNQLWMVGDNPEADVRGAEEVGIPAILVRKGDENVERHFDDLFGVQSFLTRRDRESVRIRTAGPDDAEALFQLQRSSALAAFQHIFPSAEYPFPDEAERERWTSYVSEPAATVLVAEFAGARVGVVVLEGDEIVRLFVVPERWGAGIGTLLHDSAIKLARAEGRSHSRLWVLKENHMARSFYKRRGWKLDGRSRVSRFPPNPIAVGYTLLLNPPDSPP